MGYSIGIENEDDLRKETINLFYEAIDNIEKLTEKKENLEEKKCE